MKIIGCMLCRNEDWVIGLSARVALRWCDALVVCLHECSDRSAEIVRKLKGEVSIIEVEGEWDEMRHRQLMLERAREIGATHVCIVDADEVLTGDLLNCELVRDFVDQTPVDGILYLPGYNLRNGIYQYHANGVWSNRWFAMAFPDNSGYSWKGDRFHHREPFGHSGVAYKPLAQGANERRLLAKHRMYRMTERLRWPDKPVYEIERLYSKATEGEPPRDLPAFWRYNAVPDEWWVSYAGLMKYLHLDAVPWQEEWCERTLATHGVKTFAGLKI